MPARASSSPTSTPAPLPESGGVGRSSGALVGARVRLGLVEGLGDEVGLDVADGSASVSPLTKTSSTNG